MKVVFRGLVESGKGCNCAGRKSEKVFVTRKVYHLPSGASKMFIAGHPTEVLDEDGAFLTQYTVTDRHGEEIPAFDEVK